ncbi:hypothetical protein HDU96_003984, partial [Phlyctochytrium bullatum]
STPQPDSPATTATAISTDEAADSELTNFKLDSTTKAVTTKRLPEVTRKQALVNGEETVAHVAHALTDLSFVYAVTPDSSAAAHLKSLSGTLNGSGRVHDSRVVSTQSGAGSLVHGAVAAGASASVVASSLALQHMVPTLANVAAQNRPLVLHVPALRLDRATGAATAAPVADFAAVAQAAPGLAVLVSSTVQETHDLALVAHAASVAAKKPFLHVFDASRTGTETASVAQLDARSLATLHHTVATEAASKASTCPVAAVDTTMDALAHVFGHRYAPFEYVGPAHAESVVVALGPAAALLEDAIHRANAPSVGLLKVRLLRPWSPRHLVAALPASVRRIAVVDPAAASAQGQLFLDVTAALYAARPASRPLPVLVAGSFREGPEHFVAAAADAFVAQLRDAKVRFGFSIEVTATAAEAALEDERVSRAVFWDAQADGTAAVAKLATHHAVAADAEVRSAVLRDDVHHEPVSATHVRFGSNGATLQAGAVASADYVGVHNVGVLASYDVVSAVRTGGVVLVNLPGVGTPKSADAALPELERVLSSRAKAVLATRGVRLHVIDAAKVTANYTLFEGRAEEYVNLVLEGCFLRLCRGVDSEARLRE